MTDELVIITREQWGARDAKPGIPNLAYPVPEVYQHHEAGALFAATDLASEVARMRGIQAFCMDSRGYSDFPYGVCVMPSGRVYEGRDLGFIGGGHDEQEAATGGHNANSIAILWPGNMEIQQPTDAQIAGTANIMALAVASGRVVTGFRYIAHSAATGDSTDCPGAHGRLAMPAVTAYYAAHHGAHIAPAPSPHPTPAPAPHAHPELYVLVKLPDAVRELQRKLVGACGQQLTVDGSFGPLTRAAVLNVQRFCHLKADGIVGPQTWGAIDYAALTHKPPVA